MDFVETACLLLVNPGYRRHPVLFGFYEELAKLVYSSKEGFQAGDELVNSLTKWYPGAASTYCPEKNSPTMADVLTAALKDGVKDLKSRVEPKHRKLVDIPFFVSYVFSTTDPTQMMYRIDPMWVANTKRARFRKPEELI